MPKTDAQSRAIDALTLRDYIALSLAASLLQVRTPPSDSALAKDAYSLADAFLAERAEADRG